MKQNKPLLRLGLSSVLFLCGMFALETTAIYYARYVLDNADLYVVLVAVHGGGMLSHPDHPRYGEQGRQADGASP